MALLGPMVVVAETAAADLADVLGRAGAFPIVETTWADAAAAIEEIQPVAIALADPQGPSNPRLVQALLRRINAGGILVMPVIARVQGLSPLVIGSALAVGHDEPAERLIARLRSALRVRALHATVLRRSEVHARTARSRLGSSALVSQATVLCMGRGRSYPALAVAIGERAGLIGALSVETAARYLNSRDIEGIVIGDGFAPRIVEAMLTVIAEDARFRDLPVGVLGQAGIDDPRLPNLVRGDTPDVLVERTLPLVRMQAFERYLQRLVKSLETDGVLDPETGLLAHNAFWRDLARAVADAENGGSALTVARFTFDDVDHRGSVDAARLLSRLVRNIDFACREHDGSIIAAFTETDLRSAHVVARRIASVLRQTMLVPGESRGGIKPTVTLATLKPSDNLSTLVARVGTYPKVAAS